MRSMDELQQERRMATLEANHEVLEMRLDKMEKKLDEIHSVLVMGKGVRWAALCIVAAITFIASASYYVSSLLHGLR